MTDDTLAKTAFFAASRETVWSFLTEKDKLGLWFHPADADLEDGKPYALIKTQEDGSTAKICWGTVLHMVRPSLLVWSFTVKPLDGAMTTVTWKLEEVHGGTRLSLTHEGVGAAASGAALGLLMSLDSGWDEHLASLRAAMA